MQNDWVKWLSMMKFSDNNNAFSVTSLSSFYLNKGFHLCISFSSDETTYESTCEWLQSVKAENIITHMQKILNFSLQQLEKSWESMKAQADKHQKDITYKIKNMMWLSDCNIKFMKSCWDLKNKQLKLFWVKKQMRAVYQLKLSATLWIYDVFSLKLLCSCADNSLLGQQTPSLTFIITENKEEHWEINDILNLRWYCEQLQYKVKWHSFNWDNEWYYTDRDEFDRSADVLVKFHQNYLNKLQ